VGKTWFIAMPFSSLWASAVAPPPGPPPPGARPGIADSEEARKWRNSQRTAAARKKALANKAQRREDVATDEQVSARARLAHVFFDGNARFLIRRGRLNQLYLNDLCRCCVSYVVAARDALQGKLKTCAAVINFHTVDDVTKSFAMRCEAKMQDKTIRTVKRTRNVVSPVFTNVQRVTFIHQGVGEQAGAGLTSISQDVHCPSVTLTGCKTQHIYAGFSKWALLSAREYECPYRVGLPHDAVPNAVVQVNVFNTDGLPCNLKIAALEAKVAGARNSLLLAAGNTAGPIQEPLNLFLHTLCLWHRAHGPRKIISLSKPGLLANLVRFGHLQDSSSFMERFDMALAEVFTSSFKRVAVAGKADLPSEHRSWSIRLNRVLQEHGSDLSLSAKMDIMDMMVCDLDAPFFIHFCVPGLCTCPVIEISNLGNSFIPLSLIFLF
jgi:hypothetical protein